MKNNAVRISTRQLAKELGLSQTAVQRRRRRGLTDEEILLSVEKLRQQPARKPGEHGESYFDAQRRKMIAGADLKEHAARAREAELVGTAEVNREWQRICSIISAAIMAVPAKVCSEVAGLTDAGAIAALLKMEVRAALQQASDSIAGADEARVVTGRK